MTVRKKWSNSRWNFENWIWGFTGLRVAKARYTHLVIEYNSDRLVNMQYKSVQFVHERLEVKQTFKRIIIDTSLHLTILLWTERPEILVAPQSIRVNENSKVNLECIGTGLPRPSIHWLHNGTKLPSSLQSQTDYTNADLGRRGSFGVKNTLALLSVSNDKNHGQYDCVVENVYSPSANASADILVYGKQCREITDQRYIGMLGLWWHSLCLASDITYAGIVQCTVEVIGRYLYRYTC